LRAYGGVSFGVHTRAVDRTERAGR
jgi:hypothetical protein